MGRTPCCDKGGLKKGPWTPDEDQKLTDYISVHGSGNWRTLPQNAGLQRCGKSCRLRWTNYLRPDIKRGRFSPEEEETIIQLHSILGNKWSAIAVRLPGRTDNEIKNYWNTHIRKKLLRMGIDPVTHSPRLDLLNLSSILRTYLHSNSSSPMNMSKVSGIQSYVNPEILKIASSLLSPQPGNQSYSPAHSNGQENQLHEPPFIVQNIEQQRAQELSDLMISSCLFGQLSVGAEVTMVSSIDPSLNDVVPSARNLGHDDWGSYGIMQPNSSDQDYADLVGNYDRLLEANAMDSQYDILSFRSASPTPLQSNNSTYFDSGCTIAVDDIWKINDFV